MKNDLFPRMELINSIRAELLGPRFGAVEDIKFCPTDEYLTGVLASTDTFSTSYETESILEEDDPIGEFVGFGSGEEENEDFVKPVPDLTLGYKGMPTSVGITFGVKQIDEFDGKAFGICLTWAQYFPAPESKDSKNKQTHHYIRKPYLKIINLNASENKKEEILENDLRLIIKTKKISNTQNCFKYSVYLQNNSKNTGISSRVFQPEIRIINFAHPKWDYIDLSDYSSKRNHDYMSFQFKSEMVLAKGHMTGAIWQHRDFMRNIPGNVNYENLTWIDGQYFIQQSKEYSKEEIIKFLTPDLRTEYIPICRVSNPVPTWPKEISKGIDPILKMKVLAEIINPEELASALNPIYFTYKNWINNQKIVDKDKIQNDVIIHANESARRIQEGIDFLIENENARLAFCFMNKAMDLQSTWNEKAKGNSAFEGFSWRPFQLAFILQALKSSIIPDDSSRKKCDLIWFPTGGGKTEAYLGLAVFVISYFRLLEPETSFKSLGTLVLSRYTLRLLTIQQFRRSTKTITACEYLRNLQISDHFIGWVPKEKQNTSQKGHIWGAFPFSVGLWVGGNLTPNRYAKQFGQKKDTFELLRQGTREGEAEPAQIINCPCCNSLFAINDDSLNQGKKSLFFCVKATHPANRTPSPKGSNIEIENIEFTKATENSLYFMKVDINIKRNASLNEYQNWFTDELMSLATFQIQSISKIRPGYFEILKKNLRSKATAQDFEIHCCNPKCELNSIESDCFTINNESEVKKCESNSIFSLGTRTKGLKVPAYTIDEQIYSKCPTMVISTVDKFAQLLYNMETSNLFGKAKYFTPNKGFSRHTNGTANEFLLKESLTSPKLIIQDELHLIEGPLGSMVGLLELLVDDLANHPKYVASSATVKNVSTQIKSFLNRETSVFPSPGLSYKDNFFARIHPADCELNEEKELPNRVYLGIATPGKSALLTTARLCAKVLFSVEKLKEKHPSDIVDHFWTYVGYYNAIKELAQGEALWRQDIVERLKDLCIKSPPTHRDITRGKFENLSSQKSSSELPKILSSMEKNLLTDESEVLDGVFTTSMFGTGVDVNRLSLMSIQGQPKTTSQYIQASGRVGRSYPGLIMTLYRVSKPRDLNHYEMFLSYHSRLGDNIEAITINPFSINALEKMIGPMILSFLRLSDDRNLTEETRMNSSPLALLDIDQKIWKEIIDKFEARGQEQPEDIRPIPGSVEKIAHGHIAGMIEFIKNNQEDEQLKYHSYTKKDIPVILGTLGSTRAYFEKSPNSLREVESTIILEGAERTHG